MATMQRLYSPCKILSLAQKLKIKESSENLFYDHVRVVVCRKPLQKNKKYSKNESILKIAKNGHDAKAIAHAKYKVWIKK